MLRNCISCGRVFAAGGKLCPDCLSEREEAFERVRRYLRDHPQATVDEVAEETGVSHARILAFLRNGRLVVKPTGAGLKCTLCGAPLSEGRFCRRCATDLGSKLMKTGRDPDVRVRMYSGDRYVRSSFDLRPRGEGERL